MTLNVNVIASDRFTYTKDLRLLSADHSDLGNVHLNQRLFDDAADTGFGILSTRTGKVELFAFQSAIRDAEGEMIGWQFVSVNLPRPIKVTVFND